MAFGQNPATPSRSRSYRCNLLRCPHRRQFALAETRSGCIDRFGLRLELTCRGVRHLPQLRRPEKKRPRGAFDSVIQPATSTTRSRVPDSGDPLLGPQNVPHWWRGHVNTPPPGSFQPGLSYTLRRSQSRRAYPPVGEKTTPSSSQRNFRDRSWHLSAKSGRLPESAARSSQHC